MFNHWSTYWDKELENSFQQHHKEWVETIVVETDESLFADTDVPELTLNVDFTKDPTTVDEYLPEVASPVLPKPKSLESISEFEVFGEADIEASPSPPSPRFLNIDQPQFCLGHGNSAVVSVGIDTNDFRLVALKRSSRPRSAELLHEANILKSISSPNIIQIIDFDTSRDFSDDDVLILEYIDAGSLLELIQEESKFCRTMDEGILPCEIVQSVAKEVTEALCVLQNRDESIVHNDLKPDNILLSSSGRIVLSDFGVSQILQTDENVLRSARGTMKYFSPEKYLSYDCRADVWALGLILHECCCGLYVPPSEYTKRMIEEKYSKYCADFIWECLEPDYTRRKNAMELRSHPFLSEFTVSQIDFVPQHTFDEEDLLVDVIVQLTNQMTCGFRPLSAEKLQQLSILTGFAECDIYKMIVDAYYYKMKGE